MTDILFIDSSIFIKFFVEGKNFFENIKDRYLFATSYNVLEEVVYVLLKFKAISEIQNSKHYEILEFLRQNPEKVRRFTIEIERDIRKLMEKYNIVLLYPFFNNFLEIMKMYGLLPNDALIAATCKYYGIRKIATFDKDFEKVDFLEVIKI